MLTFPDRSSETFDGADSSSDNATSQPNSDMGVDHFQRAAEHVAQIVSQLRVVAAHEGRFGEARVLPQRHFRHQEISLDSVQWVPKSG